MPVSESQIDAYLLRIKDSGVLGKGQRRTKLLEYLIRSEMGGQGDRLKAYSIGIDVLERPPSFDPSTDSIVRVEVGRLRDALALFDASSSSDGQISLHIPKGTYRPVLTPSLVPLSPKKPQHQSKTLQFLSQNWTNVSRVFIVVLLLVVGLAASIFFGRNMSGIGGDGRLRVMLISSSSSDKAADQSEIPFRFTSGITEALTKNEALTIVRQERPTQDKNVNYLLDIRFLGGAEPTMVSLELVEFSTHIIVWADAFALGGKARNALLEQAIVTAVREVTPQILNHSKQALEDRNVEELNAWELYLLATWVPGNAVSSLAWELERVDMARRAIALDPMLGQPYSVLADKLAYLSGVDADYDTPEIALEARQSATTAIRLAPNSAGSLFNISIHKWHIGDIQDAVGLSERALEVDPSNGLARLLSVLYPYTCVMAPDRILNYAREFDQTLSADNPLRWVVLTWLSKLHINRGEFELAENAETLSHVIFHTPDSVVRHAVVLHALGRGEEAIDLIEEQLSVWPNLDPSHFANVTLPRRCHETINASELLGLYADFAQAYQESL